MIASGMALAAGRLGRSMLSGNWHTLTGTATPFHLTSRSIHFTPIRRDLMEFFDEKNTWGVREVRSGRSWTKDELRIKSNVDLHKLWFILYKEKNMLLTMQAECDRVAELFPNPERIDKVEESMSRLQEVVTERDRAVKLLEVGVTGQPPSKECYGFTGRRHVYVYQEHLMPYWRNPRHFQKRYVQERPQGMMRKFLLTWREQNRAKKRKLADYEKALLYKAQEEYPDHPIWEEKDITDMTLKDVYHSKMSD